MLVHKEEWELHQLRALRYANYVPLSASNDHANLRSPEFKDLGSKQIDDAGDDGTIERSCNLKDTKATEYDK